MSPFKFLLALILCISPTVRAVDWDSEPTVDLTNLEEIRDTLPLLLEIQPRFDIKYCRNSYASGWPALWIDLDRDGKQELVRGGASFISKANLGPDGQILVLDQCNFPLKYETPGEVGFVVSGPHDLDGDGNIEIVVLGATPDSKEWGFWVVDAREFQIESHFTFAAPPERKPDGRWDGHLAVIGTLPGLLDDPEHLALVVSLNVGFDAYGRGVMAIDPFSGRVIWHYECGPKILPNNIAVVNLDGNGPDEIVFLGMAPNNLDHELLGNYSDDHSRLFVLDSRGTEVWSRQLEALPSNGKLLVGHFDAEPGLEIATISAVLGELGGKISIWSPQGNLKATMNMKDYPIDIERIAHPTEDRLDLLVSTFSGHLGKIRVEGPELVLIKKIILRDNQTIPLVFDYPPLGQPCLLFSGSENISLLDQNLDLLATVSSERFYQGDQFRPFTVNSHHYLFRYGYGSGGFAVVKNPNALPANPILRRLATTPLLAWALIFLAGLTLLSWWLLVRKHRREIKARSIIPGDGDHLREARLHLLEDLELSGHGAIAPLRSLRRLIWLLDALKTGIEFNDDLSLRFREIWTDCHQDDLPRLLVILDRARAANLSHPSITTATDALQKIQIQLAGFKEYDFAVDRLLASGDELHQHSETAEAALQSLRREVAELFTTDLESVVQRVLRANEEDIKAAGVRIQTGQMAEAAGGQGTAAVPEQLNCRIDPEELGFILDNLVGNAVRAMSGASDRQLRLTWLGTNGMVKLEVSDTGVGIATEDLDRIMETPFTTKERGGLGLPKSRRILRKYGGQLSIKSSSPGRGTTFQLLLPRARS